MLDHGPMPSSVQNVIHHILEPLPAPPDPAPQHPAVIEQQQADVALQALDEAHQVDEGNNNVEAEIENNLNEINEIVANEVNELVHAENNNNDGDNESLDGDAPEQEHNIHDDVWDLDLRQINDLYKKKTLNVDDYLE